MGESLGVKTTMKRAKSCITLCSLVITIAILMLTASPGGAAPLEGDGPVMIIEIEGTITAGQLGFIRRQIDTAQEQGAQLFILTLDTPGGLVDSTIDITKTIMGAPLPVAVLVTPTGAIAASAGSFILLSSDIAAMSPGTTVGAAHPVELTPEGSSPADDKTTTFLAEHLRNLAKTKGRPDKLAQQFVTENLTLSAEDAFEAGVIDYLAKDLDDLLTQLDGTVVEKEGREYLLHTLAPQLHYPRMSFSEKLQNLLSDPQVAFLLLMLGLLGLYLGFSNPGTFVPEVIGGILLVMGIYGIGLFDTSTTGFVLLLLGVGLIIAEIFTPGFGILGLGGGVALIAGAILLPLEPLMSAEWYSSFRLTAVGTVLAILLLAGLITYAVIHSRRRWKDGGSYFQPPQKGIVVTELNPEGQIKARGELWLARSDDGSRITVGTAVEIVRSETLFLWVRPLKGQTDTNNEIKEA